MEQVPWYSSRNGQLSQPKITNEGSGKFDEMNIGKENWNHRRKRAPLSIYLT
jgi:hypothetical protein